MIEDSIGMHCFLAFVGQFCRRNPSMNPKNVRISFQVKGKSLANEIILHTFSLSLGIQPNYLIM